MGISAKSNLESPQQWVERIRDGDKTAFEWLFRTYSKDLHRFLWAFVGKETIAEDLVQEIFTKIWEQKRSLKPSRNIKAYLYRIAHNLAIDYLRHNKIVKDWNAEKKALHRFSFNPEYLDDKLHYKIVLDDVKSAIQQLPERRRLIFTLSRFNQMTYKEIAETLDISVNTVETQMSRALKALREKFSGMS